jgi:hypothetical protein
VKSRWIVPVLALALAGCGSGGNKGSGGTDAGGPPPGGWPQAVDGKLTDKMCGLLTPADYTKYGHQLLPAAGENKAGPTGRTLGCLYMTGDELALNLQPTTEAGKLLFDSGLASHTKRMTEEHKNTQLTKDLVPGADQSWFDLSTLSSGDEFPEYELQARRGSLVVTLNLTVAAAEKAKTSPHDTLAGLARLVLERVPDLGKVDTGTTLKARYVVLGKGKAQKLSYLDPNLGTNIELKDVALPWTIDIPMPSLEVQQTVALTVLANLPPPPLGVMPYVGCKIMVGDKVVDDKPNQPLGALCTTIYTEKG